MSVVLAADNSARRDWRELAANLADFLTRQGTLRDPAWRAALLAIPRHLFVPRYYTAHRKLIDNANPAQYDRWLTGAYLDAPLVTALSARTDAEKGAAISSASQPTVVIAMLEKLQLRDGDKVLEIGTGTGYNAALLSHRLGWKNVTSIDIEPQLVAAAQKRLASLKLYPTLVVGDGTQGVPEKAPFQGIIATCAVPEIPSAWIAQLAVGGRIVAPLITPQHPGALAIVERATDTNIRSYLDEYTVYFLPIRHTAATE